jgi:hypothetical protein
MTSKRKIPAVFFELLAHRERRSARSIASATHQPPKRNEALLRGGSKHMRFAEEAVSVGAGKDSGHDQKSVKNCGGGFSPL